MTQHYKFEITSRATGKVLGTYVGADRHDALNTYARAAGYHHFHELADALGKSWDDARTELVISPATPVAWEHTKSPSGNDVITTDHHVIHIYEAGNGRALVHSRLRNSIATDGTPTDGGRAYLRELVADDPAAIDALRYFGAID